MKTVQGDIFEVEPLDAWIVIPTNVGWMKDGRNVMGRGLAKQALLKHPELPLLYGQWCKAEGDKLFKYPEKKIICLPSKPLDRDRPWLSWKGSSSPDQIVHSYQQLKDEAERNPSEFYKTTPLGSGNGNFPMPSALALAGQADMPDNVYLVLFV